LIESVVVIIITEHFKTQGNYYTRMYVMNKRAKVKHRTVTDGCYCILAVIV